ncbi:phage/plasmid primase, P4 family [Sphingomonas sp. YL-JM2C]
MGDMGGEAGGLPARAVLMATVDPLALAWKELNDMGNAARFVARAAGRMIHVREWGWVAYDLIRWSAEDGARLATLTAHEVARGIRDEIEALEALDDATAKSRFGEWCTEQMRKDRIINLHKHGIASGNANKTKAMLDQAAALDELNRPMSAFDEDPLCINTMNWTLRVRQVAPEGGGEPVWRVVHSPHDQADLLTRAMSCDYIPGADCPNWRKHMEDVLPDPEVRRYFQTLVGYALTGMTNEQIFVMLQGRGGDGKSTTMNVIRILMGNYAIAAGVETFLDTGLRGGGDASADLMRFSGDVRLISIGEPKRGARLAEERIKQFTGDSPIQARPLYGEFIEYDPRGLVFLECNAKPRISGDDDGIWRRIVVVMFPRQFKGQAIDKGQKRRLLAEGPGILNWMLEGLLMWLNDGLRPPQSVVEAVEEYRRSANPFGEWLATCVDTSDPMARESSKALYESYKRFCEGDGIGDRDIMNSTAFGRALGDRQISVGGKDKNGNKWRRGARLRDPNDMLGPDGPGGPAAGPSGGDTGGIDDWPA